VYEGTITALKLEQGYGFIASPGQPDTFFHCTSLADGLAFDEQLTELRVEFDITTTGKGPRAVNVRRAEGRAVG
jgi:cold shock CspA family protein